MKRIPALLVVLLIMSTTLGTPSPVSSAPNRAEVIPPTLPVGPDYAFDRQSYFWDFDSPYHYAAEITRPSWANGGVLEDGWFIGLDNSNDSKIWLQNAPIPNTNPTTNEGAGRSIDTSYYRYLTFRMCSSHDTDVYIYWHTTQPTSIENSGALKMQGGILQGCGIYMVDLTQNRLVSQGNIAWGTVPVNGLAIKIFRYNSHAENLPVDVKLDYARLTPTPYAPDFAISWTPQRSGTVDILLADDPQGSNTTVLATGINASIGQATLVDPYWLAPGNYTVIIRYSTGLAESTSLVVNRPPDLVIDTPSYTSGPDYATTILGNPWDFNDANDVLQTHNINNIAYTNGVFSGTTAAAPIYLGDPILVMSGPERAPIDPNRFYYFTYRFRDLGSQNIGLGSVSRILWSTQANKLWATSKDVVVFEGWRTVSFDLRKLALEGTNLNYWRDGLKDGFRFDPLEFGEPRRIEVDDMKLTGNHRASSSFTIQYTASDLNRQSIRSSVAYSLNASGANAIQIPACSTPAGTGNPIPNFGNNTTFLPLILRTGPSSCTWNLANVPNGDYYIVVTTTDGVDTVTRVSETPVEVRH